jgi:hypothetical protein
LLLTLLTVMLAVTLLSRQMMQTTIDRVDVSSASFAVEAQWIADGAARQYLDRSKDSDILLDELLKPAIWTFAQTPESPRISIEVRPSSAQDKLHLPSTPAKIWMDFWRLKAGSMELAETPDRRLLESADAALEVILAQKYITAQDAYVSPAGGRGIEAVPADYLTVWGDGKLDLNHCPLDVLRARLTTFSDMQVAGILRVRGQGKITTTGALVEQLSLSDDQRQLLDAVGTARCTCIELVIRIRKGGLSALYHAVITPGKEGRVLEVRPIY